MKPLKNAGIIKHAAKSVITESSEEFFQNLADDFIMTNFAGRQKEVVEILADAVEAGVIGAITGGVAGGIRGALVNVGANEVQEADNIPAEPQGNTLEVKDVLQPEFAKSVIKDEEAKDSGIKNCHICK